MTMAYRFIGARYYTRANRRRGDIWWIVIHDMEYPERPDSAEWCARYFAGPGSPRASAHYCVDNNSVVQSVRDKDIAWHAPPNSHSIGIEHAGYSSQDRESWLDSYSRAEMEQSAVLVANLCRRYQIPVRWLSPEDLRRGKRGITSHANVSAAFHMTDHTDPGPGFPRKYYLNNVGRHLRSRTTARSRPVPPKPDGKTGLRVAPYLAWKEWRLGEGRFKSHPGGDRGSRPRKWRRRVPGKYWVKLRRFLRRRRAAVERARAKARVVRSPPPPPRVIFTAWNPGAALQATGYWSVALSADWNHSPETVRALRSRFERVLAWADTPGKAIALKEQLGLDGWIGQAETEKQFQECTAAEANMIIGNVHALSSRQRRQAVKLIMDPGRGLKWWQEVYWGDGHPAPTRVDLMGVPAQFCFGRYTACHPLKDYYADAPSLKGKHSVYLAEGMTEEDWRVLE